MKLDDDLDFEYDYDFDEEYEEESQSLRRVPQNTSVMASAFIMVSVFILMVLVIVLVSNQKPGNAAVSDNISGEYLEYAQSVSDAEAMHANQSRIEQSVDDLISGSTLTAEDLTIWDDSYTAIPPVEAEEEELTPSEEETEDTTNQTEIIHEDGSSEWVNINPYLDLHDYNFSNLVYQSPFMKYYENNTRVSYVGVDISKEQDYVDFNELNRAGVDFVMIRLGQRGYQTGELSLDEYFADNMKRASEAGLDIGVYFFSQAITEEEALEEAEFVLDALEGYDLQYPVVFYMEQVSGMDCRIDDLDKMEKTNIAIHFMEAIEESGYIPMIYGDKEWLIQNLSLGSLIGYDVWYAEEGDLPDYPYEFTMWQYTTQGSVPGISGNANLNICFIDYSVR